MTKQAVKIVNSKGKAVRYDFIDSNMVKEMTKNSDSRVKVCSEKEAQEWIKENTKTSEVKEIKKEKENDNQRKISKQ